MDNKGPCPVCGRYQNRPLVVDGIVTRGRDILLVKRGRDPEKNKYALPGGFVDWGETAEAAVVRELFEETAMDCTVERFVGYYDSPERDPGRMTVSLVFYCRGGEGDQPRAGDDAADCGWHSLDDLPPMAFDHLSIIGDFMEIMGL